MSTQYIVKFCKNIDTNEPFVDGYIELNKSILGYGTIEFKSELNSNLVDSPNIVIFRKMLTNQYLLISYDDNNRDCFLEYSDTFNSKIKYKSVIRFDESSHSAYNEFKKNLLELTTTQMETIQYTNGRILYIGEVLYIKKEDKVIDRVANGQGTLYYNGLNHAIKYKGEWEQGKFDGAGIFYSYDGKMSLSANNISNGIPTQKGKLNINFTTSTETIDINFSDMFDKMALNKEEKINLVLSDTFVKKVAELYWHNDEPIDRTIFRDKTVDDKHVELWSQIQELNTRIDQLTTQNKQISDKCHIELQLLIKFATVLIIFTQFFCAIVF